MAKDYVPYEGPIVTLEEAKALGLKRFFTGKPCKRGHISERRVANKNCSYCDLLLGRKEEQRKWRRDYREANRERLLAERRAKYAERRTENALECARVQAIRSAALEAGAKRYFTGKPCKHGHVSERFVSGVCVQCGALRAKRMPREKKKEYRQHWIENNPERAIILMRIHRATRRAQKLGIVGNFTAQDIFSIIEKQKYKCANTVCRKSIKGCAFHIDHIVAVSKGGSNNKRNLQLLCPTCNHEKHAKDPINWAQEQGLLL